MFTSYDVEAQSVAHRERLLREARAERLALQATTGRRPAGAWLAAALRALASRLGPTRPTGAGQVTHHPNPGQPGDRVAGTRPSQLMTG
jgi:hypothetical protein